MTFTKPLKRPAFAHFDTNACAPGRSEADGGYVALRLGMAADVKRGIDIKGVIESPQGAKKTFSQQMLVGTKLSLSAKGSHPEGRSGAIEIKVDGRDLDTLLTLETDVNGHQNRREAGRVAYFVNMGPRYGTLSFANRFSPTIVLMASGGQAFTEFGDIVKVKMLVKNLNDMPTPFASRLLASVQEGTYVTRPIPCALPGWLGCDQRAMLEVQFTVPYPPVPGGLQPLKISEPVHAVIFSERLGLCVPEAQASTKFAASYPLKMGPLQSEWQHNSRGYALNWSIQNITSNKSLGDNSRSGRAVVTSLRYVGGTVEPSQVYVQDENCASTTLLEPLGLRIADVPPTSAFTIEAAVSFDRQVPAGAIVRLACDLCLGDLHRPRHERLIQSLNVELVVEPQMDLSSTDSLDSYGSSSSLEQEADSPV